jgi:hypothetical protein
MKLLPYWYTRPILDADTPEPIEDDDFGRSNGGGGGLSFGLNETYSTSNGTGVGIGNLYGSGGGDGNGYGDGDDNGDGNGGGISLVTSRMVILSPALTRSLIDIAGQMAAVVAESIHPAVVAAYEGTNITPDTFAAMIELSLSLSLESACASPQKNNDS